MRIEELMLRRELPTFELELFGEHRRHMVASRAC